MNFDPCQGAALPCSLILLHTGCLCIVQALQSQPVLCILCCLSGQCPPLQAFNLGIGHLQGKARRYLYCLTRCRLSPGHPLIQTSVCTMMLMLQWALLSDISPSKALLDQII